MQIVSGDPYADGNGRLGRILSEKALIQSLGWPVLLPLSKSIEDQRKEYYSELAKTSPATARRDLGELVKMGALSKTGERKGIRYHLRTHDPSPEAGKSNP